MIDPRIVGPLSHTQPQKLDFPIHCDIGSIRLVTSVQTGSDFKTPVRTAAIWMVLVRSFGNYWSFSSEQGFQPGQLYLTKLAFPFYWFLFGKIYLTAQ